MEAALHKTVNRSAAPRPAPAAVPLRSVSTGTVQLQSTLRVSSPRDPAEREAESTAKKILRMPAPEVAATPGERPRALQSPYIARFADALRLMRQHTAAEGGANVAGEIARSQGSGAPLPTSVRRFMEPRFRADFGQVRIHTGDQAARLNRQVAARAFTVGNQIYFGKNQYQPEAPEGRELIAHELTHTVQQGAAVQQETPVQRSEDVTVAEQSPPQVQRLGISDALNYFADAANAIPGFRMFTILIGVNPINMNRVDRSAANILRAIVEFLPGGNLITRALDNYGIFERVGGWIERQLSSLGLSGATIREAINRFLDSLGWRDIFNLGGVWDRAKRIFTEPIDRILRFARSLFSAIWGFIKDAVLRPIAQLASRTRGWDLLCAILGQNPITGEAVPRNAETLIGGFMKLIGQEEIWENIKRANAIARAWAWFQGAMSGLMALVRSIPQRFMQAVTALTIEDFVLLPRAFAKVAGVFGDFIGSFLSWAGNTVWDLLEIIFSVVAPSVMVYLRRAAAAFRTILRNPIGFVGNLVRAAVQGFRQFATNFLTHLRASLIGWLTGALSGANIYIPQAFTLREIIKFVLSVLGLTWQNIRQKIVRVIGEPAMRVLETGFEIVTTLITQGPAAAWEKIQESLTNLREMVMEQIMTFVQERIVTAAVTRLLSMLTPAGAFIQAIIAIYNTVMFFIERLRQIAQVAASFIDSISAIAAGNIASAANRVEQTMGGLLTLVISFLARLVGLGRVSDAVTNVVNRVRAPIDRALDRVVDWIVAQARRLGRLVASGARAAVQAVRGWLQARRNFRTEDGQEHTLYFEQRGNQVQLIRASDLPTEITTFLNTLSFTSDPEKGYLSSAKTLAGQITLLTRTPQGTETATTPAQETSIVENVSRLSTLLVKLVPGGVAPPVPPVDWTKRGKSATSIFSKVYYLSSASAAGGSAAGGTTPEWEFASKGGGWVRMHLIPYSVGGPGIPANWIPAPIHINSGGPVKSFETAAETLVRSAAISGPGMRPRAGRPAQPNVIWMEAEASVPITPALIDAQNRPLTFFSRLSLRSGIYRPEGVTWVKVDAPLSTQAVTLEAPEDTRIKLSLASGTQMRNSGIPHLSVKAPHSTWPTPVPDYMGRLVDLIKETRGAGFGSYAVLESRLLAATTNSRLFTPQMISDIVADLRARSQNQKDVAL